MSTSLLFYNIKAVGGCSNRVERLLHHPKVEGSSPGVASNTGKDKMAKNELYQKLLN
jgi:hypothetical protein